MADPQTAATAAPTGTFDVAGARAAGYSDADIAGYLANKTGFDVEGARKAGYDDAAIIDHLSPPPPVEKPAAAPPQETSAIRAWANDPNNPEGTNFAPEKNETPDWKGAGQIAGAVAKAAENLPADFEKTGGAVLRAFGSEAPDSPLLTGENDAQAPDQSAMAEAYSEKTPGSAANVGKHLMASAAADIQANAPNAAPGSTADYAYQITQGVGEFLPILTAGVLTKNPIVPAAMMGGQAYAEKYAESLDKGRTEDQAKMDAAFTGSANGALGLLPLGVLMKPGGTFIAKTLKSAGAMAFMNVASDIIQTGYDKNVIDPNMTWAEAVPRLEQEGIVGAVTGALFGAGEHGVEHARAPRPEPQAAPAPAQTPQTDANTVMSTGSVDDAIQAAQSVVAASNVDVNAMAETAKAQGEANAAVADAQEAAAAEPALAAAPDIDAQQQKLNTIFSNLGTGTVEQAEDGGYTFQTTDHNGQPVTVPLKVWHEGEPPEEGVDEPTITPELAAAQRDLYGKMGLDVVYIQGDPHLPFDGAVDHNQPDTIFLSNNPDRNAAQVGAHEVTHALENTKLPDGTNLSDMLHQQVLAGITAEGQRYAARLFGDDAPDRASFPAGPEGDNAHANAIVDHLISELSADIGGEAPKFETFAPKVVDAVQAKYGDAVAKTVLEKFIDGIRTAMATIRSFFDRQGTTVSQNLVTNLGEIHDTLAKMQAERFGTQLQKEQAAAAAMKDRAERDQFLKTGEMREPVAPATEPNIGTSTAEPASADTAANLKLRRWMGHLDEQRRWEAANSPQAKLLRQTEAAILRKANGKELLLTRPQRARLADVRAKLEALTNPKADTPEMDKVRAAMVVSAAKVRQSRPLAPPSTETSVLENIRRLGGIRTKDANGNRTKEGQDIHAVLKDVKRPGLINNVSGMRPDMIRENMRGRGWFGTTGGEDIQDLYDLMDKEVREGPQYHPDSEKGKKQAEKAVSEDNARATQDVIDEVKKGGGKPLTASEVEQIVENMGAHGMSAEDAVSEYLEHSAIRGLEDDYAKTGDETYAETESLRGAEGAVDRDAGQGIERSETPAADEIRANATGNANAPHPGEEDALAAGRLREKPTAAALFPEIARQSATTPIEDFGDVLTGARKHYAEAYKDRMAEAGAVDVAAEPLSKSWPEPDYAKMAESGTDPWTVGFIHAARDEIPTKPQKSWKLKGWVESVKALREFSNSLMQGTISKEALQAKLQEPEFRRLFHSLQGRIDLYQATGHDRSLKGVTLSAGSYSVYGGVRYDPAKIIWTVEQSQKATSFNNMPRILARGDTRAEAIEDFKGKVSSLSAAAKARETRFDIYSKRGVPGFFIGKKVGKTYVDLQKFDDVKSARTYLASNKDDLIAKLARMKHIPNERKETNSPRVGEDHRDGADVSPDKFSDTFGFRGVQFGNYVEGGRRQADLNEAYDALLDMAGILDVPAKALSLNGELGLAFGARGTGGKLAAAAHYEPGTVVINLTKNKGAGSLAHEWWHAMDNYFSRARGEKSEYLTERPFARGEGVRPEMVAAFRGVAEAIKATDIPKRSQVLDNRRSEPYWTTGREMSARSFESYIAARLEDQSASNDYLANIVSKEFWDAQEALGIGEANSTEPSYPYPTVDEMPKLRAAFDHLFQTVETRESDKGTALFSPRVRREEPKLSKEYENAIAAHNEAQAKYDSAVKEYRAMRIGDAEFIAAKKEYNAATAKFDEAFAKEQKRKPGDFKEEAGTAVDGHGNIVPQKIIPGAEGDAKQLAKSREAQGHGKMQAKVAQKAAGGLFGEPEPEPEAKQGVLFSPRRQIERGGNEVREHSGNDAQAAKDADALRTRISKAEVEGERRLLQKGVRPSEADDGSVVKNSPRMTPAMRAEIERAATPTAGPERKETPEPAKASGAGGAEPPKPANDSEKQRQLVTKNVEGKGKEIVRAVGGDITKALTDEDQIRRAKQIADRDFPKAVEMAMRERQAPDDVLPSFIYMEVEKRATQLGDADLIDRLRKSPFAAEVTTAGRTISSLRNRDPYSAIKQIEDVEKLRAESIGKTPEEQQRKQAEAVKEVTTQVKRAQKAAQSKRPTWEQFISSITCAGA